MTILLSANTTRIPAYLCTYRKVHHNGQAGIATVLVGATTTARVNLTNSKITRNGFNATEYPGSTSAAQGDISILNEPDPDPNEDMNLLEKCQVDIDGVTTDGMYANCAGGAYMRIKDSVFSSGIEVTSGDVGPLAMDFEGDVTSSSISVETFSNTVLNVKGNVILGTSRVGFSAMNEAIPDAPFSVAVEEGGSFQTCGNKEYDIQTTESMGKGKFTWTGKFICDQTKVDVGENDVPNCEPCPLGNWGWGVHRFIDSYV